MVSNSQVRWYSMYSIARINNRDITDLVRILLFEYYATHFMVPAIYLGIIVYRTQLIFAQQPLSMSGSPPGVRWVVAVAAMAFHLLRHTCSKYIIMIMLIPELSALSLLVVRDDGKPRVSRFCSLYEYRDI